MMEWAWFLFWFSVASLFYAYAGFPLLIALVGVLRSRPVGKQSIVQTMSLIIAAHNEEEAIGERLENALALDYPREALQIIVASDGSTDRTEQVVSTFASRGVILLPLPRKGKLHALQQAVGIATGEILVFSDANTLYAPQALRALARNFADIEVGGVAGHTSYNVRLGSESASHGENLYWNYDTWLKQMESLSGSIVSAHGGMYAIRRHLFPTRLDAAVTDDFAISSAVIEKGYRLVFESEALGFETAVPETSREFHRRVRLMTRGFRGVFLRKGLLNPLRYGFYSVVFCTHKLLRRLMAPFLLAALISAILLSSKDNFYLVAAAAQVLFYGLAGAGFLLRRTPKGAMKLFYVPFFYCMANAAAVVAFFRCIQGRRVELWEPQRHGSQA